MEEVLLKTVDFGIRVVEFSKYLVNENKKFVLIDRLLECATGIGVSMRISAGLPQYRREKYKQAYELATEAEYLFELMVKTDVISEQQSKPIRSDCRLLKDLIENLIFQ